MTYLGLLFAFIFSGYLAQSGEDIDYKYCSQFISGEPALNKYYPITSLGTFDQQKAQPTNYESNNRNLEFITYVNMAANERSELTAVHQNGSLSEITITHLRWSSKQKIPSAQESFPTAFKFSVINGKCIPVSEAKVIDTDKFGREQFNIFFCNELLMKNGVAANTQSPDANERSFRAIINKFRPGSKVRKDVLSDYVTGTIKVCKETPGVSEALNDRELWQQEAKTKPPYVEKSTR